MRSEACTIVISTYNRCNSLLPLIENMLTHASSACLLRLVDNGSTDDTWILLRDLAERYPQKLVISRRTENDRSGSKFMRESMLAINTQYVWFSHDLMELNKKFETQAICVRKPTIVLRADSGLRHLLGKTVKYNDFVNNAALMGACSELGSAIIPTDLFDKVLMSDDSYDPYAHLCYLIASAKDAGSVYVYPEEVNGRASGAIEALATHWSISENAIRIAFDEWTRCLSIFLDQLALNKIALAMVDTSKILSFYRLLILRSRGHFNLRQIASLGIQLLRKGRAVSLLRVTAVFCMPKKLALVMLLLGERLLTTTGASPRKMKALRLINDQTQKNFRGK